MNKGFFVVFLGIVMGAMALIFFNQTMRPPALMYGTPVAAAPGLSSGRVDGASASHLSSAQPPAAQTPPPASSLPAASVPQSSDSARPAAPQPDSVRPDSIRVPALPPESLPTPATKPEPALPEPTRPVPVKPEAARSEPPRAEAARPEISRPTAAVPEAPKPSPERIGQTAQAQPAPGDAQGKKSLSLVNIGVHFKGNGIGLRLEASAPFSYKAFALPSPDRYVIDLIGDWKNFRAPTIPANNMVKAARAGQQAGGPRLVLDMLRPPKKHTVTWVSPTVLEITLE